MGPIKKGMNPTKLIQPDLSRSCQRFAKIANCIQSDTSQTGKSNNTNSGTATGTIPRTTHAPTRGMTPFNQKVAMSIRPL